MRSDRLVASILAAIGFVDMTVGVWLLGAEMPWGAHGPGTVWQTARELAEDPTTRSLMMSLFRRMGAFSLTVGVSTLVWAFVGLRDRRIHSIVLIVYSATGLAFAVTDRTYFPNTIYSAAKDAIAILWVIALLTHFIWPRWRSRGGRAGAQRGLGL